MRRIYTAYIYVAQKRVMAYKTRHYKQSPAVGADDPGEPKESSKRRTASFSAHNFAKAVAAAVTPSDTDRAFVSQLAAANAALAADDPSQVIGGDALDSLVSMDDATAELAFERQLEQQLALGGITQAQADVARADRLRSATEKFETALKRAIDNKQISRSDAMAIRRQRKAGVAQIRATQVAADKVADRSAAATAAATAALQVSIAAGTAKGEEIRAAVADAVAEAGRTTGAVTKFANDLAAADVAANADRINRHNDLMQAHRDLYGVTEKIADNTGLTHLQGQHLAQRLGDWRTALEERDAIGVSTAEEIRKALEAAAVARAAGDDDATKHYEQMAENLSRVQSRAPPQTVPAPGPQSIWHRVTGLFTPRRGAATSDDDDDDDDGSGAAAAAAPLDVAPLIKADLQYFWAPHGGQISTRGAIKYNATSGWNKPNYKNAAQLFVRLASSQTLQRVSGTAGNAAPAYALDNTVYKADTFNDVVRALSLTGMTIHELANSGHIRGQALELGRQLAQNATSFGLGLTAAEIGSAPANSKPGICAAEEPQAPVPKIKKRGRPTDRPPSEKRLNATLALLKQAEIDIEGARLQFLALRERSVFPHNEESTLATLLQDEANRQHHTKGGKGKPPSLRLRMPLKRIRELEPNLTLPEL